MPPYELHLQRNAALHAILEHPCFKFVPNLWRIQDKWQSTSSLLSLRGHRKIRNLIGHASQASLRALACLQSAGWDGQF